MNKTQLIDAVATATNASKAQVAAIIAALTDTITAELANGREVTLTGFGTFKTGERSAKSGYSALAGRVVDTPAKTVPVFKAGAGLKAAVNGATVKAA